MLENIKIILNLSTDTQDTKIGLYITKVSNVVLAYCNLLELNDSLESFVEDKVVGIMESKNANANNVKAINRGDTRIEYNIAAATAETSNAILTVLDKEFLNQFRKVRFI